MEFGIFRHYLHLVSLTHKTHGPVFPILVHVQLQSSLDDPNASQVPGPSSPSVHAAQEDHGILDPARLGIDRRRMRIGPFA